MFFKPWAPGLREELAGLDKVTEIENESLDEFSPPTESRAEDTMRKSSAESVPGKGRASRRDWGPRGKLESPEGLRH